MNRDEVCLVPGGQRPRVVIFSAFNEAYAPLAQLVRPNWKRYCEAHGYGLRLYPGEFHLDRSRPQTYGDKGKFNLYYDVRGHCEIAMWLDIDSLFINMDFAVEPLLYGRNFLWTFDDNGPLSGLWIAKTDEPTEKHLRYAYDLAARENNVRHGTIEPNGISDQDAMTRLMNIPPFSDTFGRQNCVSAPEIGHCYERNYEPGKWIITFPGMSPEDKLQRMREWSAKADATV